MYCSSFRKRLFFFQSYKVILVLAVLIFLNVQTINAQVPDKEKDMIKLDEMIDVMKKEKDTTTQEVQLTKKEKKAKRIKEGKWVFTPYIAPAYSPELEFAISGGALVTFSTNPSDTLLTRSSVPVAFTISSNGSKLLT